MIWWDHYIEVQNTPAYETHHSAECIGDAEVGMITGRYPAPADRQVRLVWAAYS